MVLSYMTLQVISLTRQDYGFSIIDYSMIYRRKAWVPPNRAGFI